MSWVILPKYNRLKRGSITRSMQTATSWLRAVLVFTILLCLCLPLVVLTLLLFTILWVGSMLMGWVRTAFNRSRYSKSELLPTSILSPPLFVPWINESQTYSASRFISSQATGTSRPAENSQLIDLSLTRQRASTTRIWEGCFVSTSGKQCN